MNLLGLENGDIFSEFFVSFSQENLTTVMCFTVTDHYHRSVRKTAQTSHCPSPSIKNKCGAATV